MKNIQKTLRYLMKIKKLRIEKFLDDMNNIMPWKKLVRCIKTHYMDENSAGGRTPHNLELMLRIHLLQLWHNLS